MKYPGAMHEAMRGLNLVNWGGQVSCPLEKEIQSEYPVQSDGQPLNEKRLQIANAPILKWTQRAY